MTRKGIDPGKIEWRKESSLMLPVSEHRGSTPFEVSTSCLVPCVAAVHGDEKQKRTREYLNVVFLQGHYPPRSGDYLNLRRWNGVNQNDK